MLDVILTHCGNWSLGGVVCRSSSGWVRVTPWVLITWVASENSYMIVKLMLYVFYSETFQVCICKIQLYM